MARRSFGWQVTFASASASLKLARVKRRLCRPPIHWQIWNGPHCRIRSVAAAKELQELPLEQIIGSAPSAQFVEPFENARKG